MKRLKPARWFGSTYSYNWQSGVAKQRSGTVFLYFLAIALPASLLILLSDLHPHTPAPLAKTNLSSPSLSNQPSTQPQIPASTVAAVSYQDPQLDSIINGFISSNPNHQWSVSVQGLDGDNRSSTVNAAFQYDSASLYKLLLLYPLAQKLPFGQWAGKQLMVEGKSISLSNCVTAMLRVSDNDCGDAVGNYVGWAYADSQLKAIGLKGTELNNGAGPVTTAADVTYFLQGLYSGKWFDDSNRNFIVNILRTQIFRSGIPAGCGSTCIVADKVGDLGDVRHDAGIVRYSGGTYVLTVMTDGASYGQIAELASQIQAHMAAQN